jgi:hypothetical protein
MAETHVIEITETVEFEVKGDRVHFTLTSGKRKFPFSISFHKARNAAHTCVLLLDQREESANRNVRAIRKKAGDHG